MELTQVQRTLVSDESGHANIIYMAVTWHRLAGGGLHVDRIQLSVNANGDWNTQCVDGYSLRIYNDDNDTIQWEKTACDVAKPGYNHEFAPEKDLPNAGSVRVRWSGKANINNAPDKEFALTAAFSR